MGWRVSGGTWMVTLDGLGYKFAGWEAAGGIREASGCLGAREAAYGPHPNPGTPAI